MLSEEDEELVKRAEGSLLDYMVGDAEKAFKASIPMGAMILASCSIEVMGYYLLGGRANCTDSFNSFIRNYMPKYVNLHRTYGEVRCALVHSYSSGAYDYVADPTLHLKVNVDGKTCIHVETFILDIKDAAKNYFGDVRTDTHLFNNLKAVSTISPFLEGKQIEVSTFTQNDPPTIITWGTGSS